MASRRVSNVPVWVKAAEWNDLALYGAFLMALTISVALLTQGKLAIEVVLLLAGEAAIIIAGSLVELGQLARGLRMRAAQHAEEASSLARTVTLLGSRTAELERDIRLQNDIVETQTDIVIRRKPDLMISFVNGAYSRAFGRAREDLIGSKFVPVARGASARLEGAIAKGRHYDLEIETVQGWRWFEIDEIPIRDGQGKLIETQIVGRNITDRKRVEEEVKTARDAAEAASRAKTMFLATMSYEIRTPMNGVLGMTGLLLDSQLTPEQLNYAKTVRESGEGLLALINDILDFSKIETGAVHLETEVFDVHTLIESVAELLAPRAHEKGLAIETIVAENMPLSFEGDAGRLRQVLVNLAGNGVKFTEGGGVTLKCSLAGGTQPGEDGNHRLLFEVSDTGIGVPEVARDAIFEQFVQADSSHARRYGGSGLGLAISKRIIEAMNGRIGLDTQMGKGSTFWFMVPLPARSDVVEPAASDADFLKTLNILVFVRSAIVSESLKVRLEALGARVSLAASSEAALGALKKGGANTLLIDSEIDGEPATTLLRRAKSEAKGLKGIVLLSPEERSQLETLKRDGFSTYLIKPVRALSLIRALKAAHGREAFPAQAGAQPNKGTPLKLLRPLRVLLAEDNQVNALLATALLTRAGHRVDPVANGLEALEALDRADYDVVLMDVHMPELDGLETTRRIRALEGPKAKTPIIAVTANAMDDDRRRCLDAGMNDFVTKPIAPDALFEVLLRTTHEGEKQQKRARGGPPSAG